MEIGRILQFAVYYSEIVALICGLIFIKKYFHTSSKYIPMYLFLVVVVETIGYKTAFDQWYYNILCSLEVVVFFAVFYNIAEMDLSKKVIKAAFAFSVAALLIDGFFFKKTFEYFLANGFAFASIGITMMCFAFLYELAKSERIIHMNRILLYWVVIGLLIFHLCNLPVTLFTHELFEIGNVEGLLIIQSIAALCLYICYSIGFVWSRKEYNY